MSDINGTALERSIHKMNELSVLLEDNDWFGEMGNRELQATATKLLVAMARMLDEMSC